MNNEPDRGFRRIKTRLEHWLGLANAGQIAKGKTWYTDARAFAMELGYTYCIPFTKVVGVIAALSPAVRWDANKQQAENLCRAFSDGGPLEAVVLTTYGKQAKKAMDILSAQPVDIRQKLGERAFKTRAFFDNICHTQFGSEVTVDQHIIAAAGFTDFWVQGARWCYKLIESVIQKIAEEHRMVPCQVQAIIWLTYKDLTDSKNRAERAAERRATDAELPF